MLHEKCLADSKRRASTVKQLINTIYEWWLALFSRCAIGEGMREKLLKTPWFGTWVWCRTRTLDSSPSHSSHKVKIWWAWGSDAKILPISTSYLWDTCRGEGWLGGWRPCWHQWQQSPNDTSVVSVPGGSAMICSDKSQRTNKNNAVFFFLCLLILWQNITSPQVFNQTLGICLFCKCNIP